MGLANSHSAVSGPLVFSCSSTRSSSSASWAAVKRSAPAPRPFGVRARRWSTKDRTWFFLNDVVNPKDGIGVRGLHLLEQDLVVHGNLLLISTRGTAAQHVRNNVARRDVQSLSTGWGFLEEISCRTNRGQTGPNTLPAGVRSRSSSTSALQWPTYETMSSTPKAGQVSGDGPGEGRGGRAGLLSGGHGAAGHGATHGTPGTPGTRQPGGTGNQTGEPGIPGHDGSGGDTFNGNNGKPS